MSQLFVGELICLCESSVEKEHGMDGLEMERFQVYALGRGG